MVTIVESRIAAIPPTISASNAFRTSGASFASSPARSTVVWVTATSRYSTRYYIGSYFAKNGNVKILISFLRRWRQCRFAATRTARMRRLGRPETHARPGPGLDPPLELRAGGRQCRGDPELIRRQRRPVILKASLVGVPPSMTTSVTLSLEYVAVYVALAGVASFI